MRGEIRANGLLIVSAAAIGAILGASQVLLLAYCAAVGASAGIALALGLNSGASLVGAILIGSKADWRWTAERRFAIAAIFFALATIPTAFVTGYLPYLIATTIAGFGIAPMFIQQNAVIAERAGGSGAKRCVRTDWWWCCLRHLSWLGGWRVSPSMRLAHPRLA